ncbi:MAG: Beta-hexosaminidase, partial [Pseudomonadota bacterium]
MIYGIGTDIVMVRRIEDLIARYGERFARRVLGPDELAEYQRRHGRGAHGPAYAARYLAKRFAAKEAFSKAIGLGLRGPMTLLSLQILNDRRGKPVAVACKALEPWLRERGLVAQVSLTDEQESVVAFVVVEEERASQRLPSFPQDGGLPASPPKAPADSADPPAPSLNDSAPPATAIVPTDRSTRKSDMSLSAGPVVLDVAGLTLDDSDRARLAHPLVGGVILFARNFESRAQVTGLCASIRALRPGLMICVDHEGGRVQRFREGFSRIPAMRELGEHWDRDMPGACQRATEIGQTIGRELIEVGVDLSFTPVLDLDHGRSEVIGDRAFHRDPNVVTMLARALNHGLLLSGMANCGKHFPGHGWADADSHHALPVDERSLAQILSDDAAPYGRLGDALAAVMPAHVVYPAVDSLPAGFSRRWLQEILRGQLGFRGLIFSDDLTMEGACVAGDIVARANAAFEAGCDMVLVCNRPDEADRLLDGLTW